MRRVLTNRYFLRVLAILIGLVFIWASLDKLRYPDRFADIVRDYDLLPLAFVNAFALVMPWLEVVTGVALIAGLWRRAAGLLSVGLFSLFLIAIAQALLRGLKIECGCFDVSGMTASEAGWNLFARDVVLLAASLLVWREG